MRAALRKRLEAERAKTNINCFPRKDENRSKGVIFTWPRPQQQRSLLALELLVKASITFVLSPFLCSMGNMYSQIPSLRASNASNNPVSLAAPPEDWDSESDDWTSEADADSSDQYEDIDSDPASSKRSNDSQYSSSIDPSSVSHASTR